ncbi:LysR family transcriptional regulator [Vibrio rotiferianus]|uniref:LysR family transcriptional regulator n=1 Tax=Vibrio rotiferianus TaxID=190895 RepID=UPI00406A96EC
MKYENMKLFHMVVDKGGITAAADFSGLPKSTVSRRIKDLENILGTKLLNRSSRRFQLTPTGEVFYTRSKDILKDVEALEEDITHNQNLAEGKITILSPSPLIQCFSKNIKQFYEQYPQIELDIYAQNVVARNLPKRRFDLVLQLDQPEDSNLIGKKVSTITADYYASPDYLAQFGSPNTPEELIKHRIIFRGLKEAGAARWPFQNPKRYLDLSAAHTTVVDSPEIALTFTLQGLGIALLPDLQAASEVKNGRLVPLFDKEHRYSVPIYLLYQARDYIPFRLRLLIDFITDNFQDALDQDSAS